MTDLTRTILWAGGLLGLATLVMVIEAIKEEQAKRERYEIYLPPPPTMYRYDPPAVKQDCSTCKFRRLVLRSRHQAVGFACTNPKNHWPKWKARKPGQYRIANLSPMFYPAKPAFCKGWEASDE